MKRAVAWMTALIVIAVLPCRSAYAEGKPSVLYVATDGAHKNPGTMAEPFATLERARDAIRELKKKDGLPQGGVTVWVRGGVHYLSSTFDLAKEDSGTKSSPVVYRAYGEEKVWLSGGQKIDPTHFKAVTDPAVLKRVGEEARDELVQLDMAAEGITDYLRELPDKLTYTAWEHNGLSGAYVGNALILELFSNGERMPLARWPNEGFAVRGKTVAGVRERGKPLPKVGKFLYEGDRPDRWNVEEGVWLRGYMGRGYAFESVKVGRIDTAKRQIDLVTAPFYRTKIAVGADDSVVYDVLTGQPVPVGKTENRRELPIVMPRLGGTLLMFLPRPIAQLELTAPKSVKTGGSAPVTIRLKDGAGELVPGVIPIELGIRGATGSQLRTEHVVVTNGEFNRELIVPVNETAKQWSITASTRFLKDGSQTVTVQIKGGREQ